MSQESELPGKREVARREVIEGEFIGADDYRPEMNGPGMDHPGAHRPEMNGHGPERGATMRGWGAHGGQAVFRQFNLKPVPKALIIPAIAIFVPIAAVLLLLFTLAMFGRLAFHLLRMQRRG